MLLRSLQDEVFRGLGAVSDRSDVGGGGRVDGPPGRGVPPSPLTLGARDGQTERERNFLMLTDLVAETCCRTA